jgi:hypothetical protein
VVTASTICGALYAFLATTELESSSAVVKGWGVLMQAMKAVEGYVANGELSSVHNEDIMLSSAISVLRAEARRAAPGKGEQAARLLSSLSQELGDLHQAADAFDAAASKSRLHELLATYRSLLRLYGDDVLGPARRLAEVWACPMHREVVGKSNDSCGKCGMVLDQPVRIPLLFSGGVPAQHTVRATIRTEAALERGEEVKGILRLTQLTGAPILITDLRVVHTQRIHLLIIDPSLTDYHHVHPEPTAKPGEYAFRFTPTQPGSYRAWADLRTTYGGFQEYASADLPAATAPAPRPDPRVSLRAEVEGLRYTLSPEKSVIRINEPVRLKLRVTDKHGKPFRSLEPIMATFAHLVGFNEDYRTVLHLHPKGNTTPRATDRGGPDLEFQLYATEPGLYRLFAQVQIGGVSKFAPFSLIVTSPLTAKR